MMSDQTALVPTEQVYLGSLALAPEAVVERATRIANALAKVIKERHLSKKIGPSEHVLVEGWATLGALVGISPKEREVKHLVDDGIHEYEAYVDLVRTDTGIVVGGGSAICRSDEQNWRGKPQYAIRSMAITRATGKAFRLKLAFVMELAGFATTPAEEMDGVDIQAHEPHAPAAKNGDAKPRSTAVTDFWKAIRDAGKTQEDGKRILELCHQDFEMALKSLNEAAPF
jgi:hypothetical protein